MDGNIHKYGDVEESIRENLDTWLCNLYFSIDPKESLTNPYTTQLDLDNEAHGKILQILDLEHEGEGEEGKDARGAKYQQVDPGQIAVTMPQTGSGRIDRIADLLKEPTDIDEDYDDIPRSGQPYGSLTNPEDYDKYTYHIPHLELKSRASFTGQVTYIVDEVLADLGFRNLLSFEFWYSSIIFLLMMWARSFIHPFGSWIYLKASGIPVTSFNPELYGMMLEYPMSTIGAEIGVTLIGNIATTVVFGFLIFICWFLEKFVNGAPSLLYRIVAAYGIAAVGDYLLLAVVDVAVDVRIFDIQ